MTSLPLAVLLAACAFAGEGDLDTAVKFQFKRPAAPQGAGDASAAGAGAGAPIPGTCSPSQSGKDKNYVKGLLKKVASDCEVKESEFAGAEFQEALDFEACKIKQAYGHTYGRLKDEVKGNPGVKLSGDFLKKVHGVVAGGWGTEGATIGMQVAVEPFLDRVSKSGAKYLGELSGVPADDASVAKKYPGSLVYDCNLSGKVDEKDAVLTYAGEEVSAVKILSPSEAAALAPGPSLSQFDKDIQEAFKKVAPQMKGKIVWGNAGSSFNGNPDVWNVGKDGYLELKEKVKPAAAVHDMVKDQGDDAKKYKLECVTGMQAALYLAILEYTGDENFNKIFKSGELVLSGGFSIIRLPPDGYAPPDIKPYLEASGDATKPADAEFFKKLKPGTLVYFKNPGASPPWHGENAIYLGEEGGVRQYFAHPFGVASENDILDKLNTKGGSRGEAYLHQGTISIKPSLASLKK